METQFQFPNAPIKVGKLKKKYKNIYVNGCRVDNKYVWYLYRNQNGKWGNVYANAQSRKDIRKGKKEQILSDKVHNQKAKYKIKKYVNVNYPQYQRQFFESKINKGENE